jgi:thioesterase domain-containing protein/acyl carrier protein
MLRAGAGRLEPSVAQELEEVFQVPVIQAYSSTETSFIACEPLPPKQRKRGSVGLPGNAKVAIVDEHGKQLPPNTAGEVVVSGSKIFDGYESNSQANAEAFRDGWFRMGDLGYFDENGYLFLTGRIKEIINRGGQKVSPSEIEAAIIELPGVVTAAAFPVPHPTLGEDVAAAVVLKPGSTLDVKTLSAALREMLGETKLPRRILFVDEIPKGATGKIQRNRLAAAFGLDGPAPQSGKGGVAATPTERTLLHIWADTLKLPTVPVDENFFSLGGDSLLAVELFLRIEETMGRRLPRAALFEASTVAEMARYIDAAWPARCLVPIQPGGERPPLFCVHDIFGHVLNFRALAAHLGPEQPVYGLQLVGLDGSEVPLGRIEDMASRYLSEIGTVQPTGPYHLGGYSMGGLVAYEMARQLRAAGEDVGLLALFDTFARHGPRRSTLPYWFGQRDNRLDDLRPSSVARYLGRGARNVARNARTQLRRRLFGVGWRLSERTAPDIPQLLRRPVAANLLASRRYRMRPYDGDAVLFSAADFRRDHDHMVENWRRLVAGRLTVHEVPGTHNEILQEPHVRALARLLTECLRDAAERTPDADDTAATG